MLLVHVHPIAPLLQSLAAHWLLFHASSTFFSHILRLVCTNTSIDGYLVFEILRFRSILFQWQLVSALTCIFYDRKSSLFSADRVIVLRRG